MNTFFNFDKAPKDYLGIIEVRDPQGVTIFLAWQTSTMPAANVETGAYGENTIGMSWSPKEPGQYEVRSFAVTGFENTQILSGLQQKAIRVN